MDTQTAMLVGILFLAALPAAAINFIIWKHNEAYAAAAALGGFAIGMLGGLLFAVPYTLVSVMIKAISQKKM